MKHNLAQKTLYKKLKEKYEIVKTEETCLITGLRPDITILTNNGCIYVEIGSTSAEKIKTYLDAPKTKVGYSKKIEITIKEIWWYERETLTCIAKWKKGYQKWNNNNEQQTNLIYDLKFYNKEVKKLKEEIKELNLIIKDNEKKRWNTSLG